MIALRMKHLSKTYPPVAGVDAPVTALADVDLEVAESEFVVVVGPSGCGKSTLLRLVSGIMSPSAGSVQFESGDSGEPGSPNIGMVFQTPVLLPWLSTLRNVLFPARLLGRSTREYQARARELISLVGLAGFEDHYPWQLSGGMQHRAALARALVTEPDILLMDEPFASLDILTREQMAVELARIWAVARTTVLFITHSIEEAVFLADRVVVLSPRPGRVIGSLVIDAGRPRTWQMLAEPEIAGRVAEIREQLTGSAQQWAGAPDGR
jgi:NitT/TauT family transport system ATP-binding protein